MRASSIILITVVTSLVFSMYASSLAQQLNVTCLASSIDRIPLPYFRLVLSISCSPVSVQATIPGLLGVVRPLTLCSTNTCRVVLPGARLFLAPSDVVEVTIYCGNGTKITTTISVSKACSSILSRIHRITKTTKKKIKTITASIAVIPNMPMELNTTSKRGSSKTRYTGRGWLRAQLQSTPIEFLDKVYTSLLVLAIILTTLVAWLGRSRVARHNWTRTK